MRFRTKVRSTCPMVLNVYPGLLHNSLQHMRKEKIAVNSIQKLPLLHIMDITASWHKGQHKRQGWEKTNLSVAIQQKYDYICSIKLKMLFAAMRVIQTFWTAKGNPLLSTYGWTHPRYNAMSWALSCLCLHQHFNDIELYTDTAGYQFLIEKLGLPYKKAHVVLDDFFCLPYHWALSKIKVYSMQESPFVHVDGDIYLPNGLPDSLLAAKLIAQNKEFGTDYYRKMMDGILACQQIHVPAIAQKGISRKNSSPGRRDTGIKKTEHIPCPCGRNTRVVWTEKHSQHGNAGHFIQTDYGHLALQGSYDN